MAWLRREAQLAAEAGFALTADSRAGLEAVAAAGEALRLEQRPSPQLEAALAGVAGRLAALEGEKRGWRREAEAALEGALKGFSLAALTAATTSSVSVTVQIRYRTRAAAAGGDGDDDAAGAGGGWLLREVRIDRFERRQCVRSSSVCSFSVSFV